MNAGADAVDDAVLGAGSGGGGSVAVVAWWSSAVRSYRVLAYSYRDYHCGPAAVGLTNPGCGNAIEKDCPTRQCDAIENAIEKDRPTRLGKCPRRAAHLLSAPQRRRLLAGQSLELAVKRLDLVLRSRKERL